MADARLAAAGLAATGIASWTTGAIVGGFIGAMLTRGMEKEVADFYDQEVQEGEILVAAEDHGPNAAQRLATAERILAEAGTEPMPLPEG